MNPEFALFHSVHFLLCHSRLHPSWPHVIRRSLSRGSGLNQRRQMRHGRLRQAIAFFIVVSPPSQSKTTTLYPILSQNYSSGHFSSGGSSIRGGLERREGTFMDGFNNRCSIQEQQRPGGFNFHRTLGSLSVGGNMHLTFSPRIPSNRHHIRSD